jgi:branched-subunit amino acid transport protein
VLDLALHNARIPAAIVAALAAWRTRGMLWTIVSGMLVFWIWGMIAP